MLEPSNIIEIDGYLSDEELTQIEEILKTNFSVKKVESYSEKEYTDRSEFADTIYKRMFEILASENSHI